MGSKKILGQSSKIHIKLTSETRREAIKESLEDISEGADIIMVKLAGYYLDIIRDFKREKFNSHSSFSSEWSTI